MQIEGRGVVALLAFVLVSSACSERAITARVHATLVMSASATPSATPSIAGAVAAAPPTTSTSGAPSGMSTPSVPTSTPTSAATPIATPTASTPVPTATPPASPTSTPTAVRTPSLTATTVPTGGVRRSNIERSTFDANITIPVGTTVIWTNLEGVSHTVTSMDLSIDSPFLSGRESFSHTFTSPGRIEFWCRLHQQMAMTVVVQ